MSRVITFVRRIAGLLEPSLESEFFEEFNELSNYLETLVVVSDMVDPKLPSHGFKIYKAWTMKVPKIYAVTKILSYCHALFKCRRVIDVIYVRTLSPPECIALLFGKNFLKKKAVILIPGTWLFEPSTIKNKIFKWIYSKALYSSDRIIAYTEFMLPSLKRHFPRIRGKRIAYVHNAVNTRRFRPGEPDKKVLSKYLSSLDQRILLYVGEISARKGVLDLVRAFSIIKTKEPKANLVIAGREDKKYGRELKNLLKQLKLTKSVNLLGPVPNRDVAELMKASEVFLYASLWGEGIPRAILEAMACGKPVIATRVSGIPEVVRDGETGFLVNVGDYHGLAEMALKVLKDDELRARLGRNARRLIEEEFSYDVIIPKLAKIISSV